MQLISIANSDVQLHQAPELVVGYDQVRYVRANLSSCEGFE